MKSFKNILALVPTLFLAVACSVGVDGGSLVPDLPDYKPNTADKVKGPALDGTWLSKCDYSYRDSNYRKLTLGFRDRTLTRKTEIYYDYSCAQLKSKKTETGTFRFMEDKGNDIFEVEYRIDLGNGVTAITGEVLKLSGQGASQSLWISDFVIGDVAPTIQLTKAPAFVEDEASMD